VPFSFVHFFWAQQKKWTNGFKRCVAPFIVLHGTMQKTDTKGEAFDCIPTLGVMAWNAL